jgi:hypothetical protein
MKSGKRLASFCAVAGTNANNVFSSVASSVQ